MNKSIAIIFVVAAFAVALTSATIGYRSSHYPYQYGPNYAPSYGPNYAYRGFSAQVGVVPAYSSYQPYYQPYYGNYYGPSYYPYPYASSKA